MGILFALLSAVSWGISNVFTRKAQLKGKTDRWSGLFITLVVNNMLNLVVFAVYLFFRVPTAINATGILLFAAGGLFNSFIGRGLLFMSINRLGAPKAGVIKGITPVFVLFGGVFLLGESLATSDALGIFLALSGVMVVSLDMICGDRKQLKVTGERGMSWQGIVFGVMAACFLASGNISRKAGLTYIPDAILGVTVGGVAGLIFITIFLAATKRLKQALRATLHMDGAYFMSGLFASLALLFVFLSFNVLPVSVANSFTASEPIFTILASYLILRQQDRITWRLVLGGVLVISGAVVLVLL